MSTNNQRIFYHFCDFVMSVIEKFTEFAEDEIRTAI